MSDQPGFFDLEHHYERLSATGDPLERLVGAVNFEAFRYRLEKALKRSDRTRGGRPPCDPVLVFKVLILQALYDLSDAQAECMIRDRLSFLRFLGLGLADAAPDATTIWLFREQLVKGNAMEKLFARFDKVLTEKGYLAMSGCSWMRRSCPRRASATMTARRKRSRRAGQRRRSGRISRSAPGRRACPREGGGRRRPLDGEGLEGEAACRRAGAARPGRAGVRIQESSLHGSPPRADPQVDGDGGLGL